MKLLIAYDGSPCSESALDDLGRAGLPEDGEAVIITVAEIWLPPPGPAAEELDETEAYLEEIVRKHRIRGQRLLNEAEIMAKHAVDRVRRLFPRWTVTSKATYGSPAWDILTAADELQPDLIVLGSHGRSIVGRVLLGSVSQKIMTEAKCTVRIARGRIDIDSAPGHLVIGFDGSKGANAAVEWVAKRHWPSETEVQLISATDSLMPAAIGRFIPPALSKSADESNGEYSWMINLADKASDKLAKVGLKVNARVVEGNPNQVIVAEAEAWHADCIFVGANTEGSRLARFLLGSTTSAVAARAHCSVEVVRC